MKVKLANGHEMPMVGLGTYQMQPKQVKLAIDVALECGYRLFDTAAVYRNEQAVGEALHHGMDKFKLNRADLFITTKLAPADHGYEAATLAIQRSLTNLNLDYIDLYLIHWPGVKGRDPADPEQAALRQGSWRAVEEAYQRGIIRSLGISNYEIRHLEELLAYARVPPVVNQIEVHPQWYPRPLIAWCQAHDIHIQAYSSLARGNLLKSHAHAKGAAQIMLRWAIEHGFSVLPKSVHPERICQNIDLDFRIDNVLMHELDNQPIQSKVCWDPSSIQ